MAKKSSYVRKRRTGAMQVSGGKTYRVLVDISPHETVRNLGGVGLDYCCMPQPPADSSGRRRVHAYAPGATVTALRQAGRAVEVLADATAEGKRAQKNVSKVDRFKAGRSGPPGAGELL